MTLVLRVICCLRSLLPLCPVGTLATYLECTKTFRGSTQQILVCYGGSQRGQPLTSKGLSRWLSMVLTASLESTNGETATAHSTRGVATSVALFQGVSVEDICKSARWSSSNTFGRYYLRHVGSNSFSTAVLNTAQRKGK